MHIATLYSPEFLVFQNFIVSIYSPVYERMMVNQVLYLEAMSVYKGDNQSRVKNKAWRGVKLVPIWVKVELLLPHRSIGKTETKETLLYGLGGMLLYYTNNITLRSNLSSLYFGSGHGSDWGGGLIFKYYHEYMQAPSSELVGFSFQQYGSPSRLRIPCMLLEEHMSCLI